MAIDTGSAASGAAAGSVMGPYGALAGAVAAPVIGGLFGASAAAKGRAAAAQAAQAALAQLNALGMPPDLSKELILQKFQEAGQLTPELEQQIQLQASEMGNVKEDPSLRANQMDVLNTLAQQSRGGLQAGDRAAYNELRSKVQQDSEAKRQQIMQQMQAQGQGSSGASLMAQLQSSQGAADQAAAGSDRLAATAAQNALAALSQRGQQAGQLRSQDFSNASALAQAQDQRNQFLMQNSSSMQARNIAAQNAAQASNLANKQQVSSANTQTANAELARQNQAKQQYWDSQMGLATAKANALNNQGTVAQQGANAQANMYAGIGNALGQGIGAYGASSIAKDNLDATNAQREADRKAGFRTA
jgi:hypothetical protein